MKKYLYELGWIITVGVPIIEALNLLYPTVEVTDLFYRVIFWLIVGVVAVWIVPFLLDFFEQRKHVYNRIMLNSALNVGIIWFLNDFMPHFYLREINITRFLVFAVILGIWLQSAYKISKKL